MDEFKKRLNEMIESRLNNMPEFEVESQIDHLFKLADGNSERMIDLWCELQEYQHVSKYSKKFEEVAKLCGDDIDKKIKVWRQTLLDVKINYTDFFNGMLPKLQELAVSEPKKVLLALRTTAGHKEMFNDVKILNDIINKVNPQLPAETLDFLMRLEMNTPEIDEEKWRSLKYVAENNSSFEKLISAYSLKSYFFDLDENRAKVSFKAIVDKLKEQPMQFAEAVADGKISYLDEELLGIMVESTKQLKKEGKEVRFKEIDVSLEQYEVLKNANMEELGLDVTIVCKNASEISVQDAEKMMKKGFKSIRFLARTPADKDVPEYITYKLEEYKACREKIDELLEGLSVPTENDPNKEKKVFMQVMQRLANHICFDNDHVSEHNNINKKRRELLEGEGTLCNDDFIKIDEEEEKIDYVTPRNMIGGLIMRKSVCAGYAEIVRNTLACIGIEAIYVSGLSENGLDGHAWNQVKLDGQWYNMDLTWSRKKLIEKDLPTPLCLLMNDKDFAFGVRTEIEGESYFVGGHKEYSKGRSEEHECFKTVPEEELYSYITDYTTQKLNSFSKDLHKSKYKEWIDKAATFFSKGKIRQVGEFLKSELRNNERGQEHVKEPRDR